MCFKTSPAVAMELEISGNGSQSVSSTEVDTHSSQSVVSTNESAVTNTVDANANSGTNTVSGNSGNSTVSTGSISNKTQVDNTGNTSSVVSQECCSGASAVKVTDNGVGTANSVDVKNNQSTTVTTSNKATIFNNIQSYGNTGNNSVSHNVGNSVLETGKVTIHTSVTNSSINNTVITTSSDVSDPVDITISSNGENSVNEVIYNDASSKTIRVLNNATIENNILIIGNSGDNTMIGNTGLVTLKTGDVVLDTTLENVGINSSIVNATNCCVPDKPTPEQPGHGGVIIPSNPSTNSSPSYSSSGIGGGGEVLAAAIGDILPATGSNMGMWAAVFNVFMLLMGLYLRNRSGRAPCTLTFEFVW